MATHIYTCIHDLPGTDHQPAGLEGAATTHDSLVG